MPPFHVTVLNGKFSESSEHDLPSPEAARAKGIETALHIAADQIANGQEFLGAQIEVENEGELVAITVVSVKYSVLH